MDHLENYIQNLKEFKTRQAHDALEFLKRKGLPNKKWEDWKYTQISSYLPSQLQKCCNQIFTEIPPPVVKLLEEKINLLKKDFGPAPQVLLFYNGKFVETLSTKGEYFELNITQNDDTLIDESQNFFHLINLPLVESIATLTIKENTSNTSPLFIFHINDSEFLNTRLNIHIAKSSSLTIIEYFTGTESAENKTLRNHITNCQLAEMSSLFHIKVVDEKSNRGHISSTESKVQKNAHFFDFTLPLKGDLIRCDFQCELLEHNAQCTSNGLFNLYQKEHFDLCSKITHSAEETSSSQLYKGVLHDESHGIFNAKIVISKNCNGSQSAQLNKNLLVGEKALIHTRPQLEVYSDDVQCSHGATTGQLGQEEIFYLQSRGINEEDASRMLTKGFIVDVLSTIKDDIIQNFLLEKIHQRENS